MESSLTNAVYTVAGMHCVTCAGTIEKLLQQQEGVQEAKVNFAGETLTVSYDSQRLNFDSLASLVAEAGYQVQKRKLETGDDQEQQALPRFPRLPLLLLLPLEVLTVGRHFWYPSLLAGQPIVLMLLQFILAAGIFYSARSLIANGSKALWRRAPNMNSLIAIATVTALLYSTYLSLRLLWGEVALVDDLAFETGSLILFFVLLGHYFEERSRHRGRGAIAALAKLQPRSARLQRDEGEVEVAVEDLQPGEIAIVRAGERIPADGTVYQGEPWIDQSIITGESLPVQKHSGDTVVTGALNQTVPFLLRIEQVGENTALARITAMVLKAQGSQMPINRLADRISAFFVPLVIGIALLSGVVWYLLTGELGTALDRFVAVLIISCPCALGLASPMAVMVAIGKGMRLGFIVRHGEVLEKLRQISKVVFDKTGTLTQGHPAVSDVLPVEPFTQQQLLELAASGESYSEHPLAQSVLDACREKGFSYQQPDNFNGYAGLGISYGVGSNYCLLGSVSYLKREGIELGDPQRIQALQNQGKTILALAVNQQLAGLIAVRDPLKESSAKAIARLARLGTPVVLLSGDNQLTANAIGSELGIDRIIADVLPEDKQNVIASLEGEGEKTVMVGDGVNDAPALALASVGMAMGGGSDISHESGEVILMNDDPYSVVQVLNLGRKTVRVIKQNLFWAFAYNSLAIPLAAGVLIPFGLPGISPIVAAPLMAVSSITVVLNALRLERMSYN